jgi:hypothetical protein
MYIRDLEKLSVESGQNPAMGEWINPDALTQMRLGMMTLPSRGIVKTVEQVNFEREEKAKTPPPPTPEEVKLQIEQGRMALEERRLAIEEKKIEFEMLQGQKREEMEFIERQNNTYARIAEAESQLARAQTDKEIAFLQLAQKSESEQVRSQIMGQIAIMTEETKRILGGLQHAKEARDQLLTRRELELKAKTGSGI